MISWKAKVLQIYRTSIYSLCIETFRINYIFISIDVLSTVRWYQSLLHSLFLNDHSSEHYFEENVLSM